MSSAARYSSALGLLVLTFTAACDGILGIEVFPGDQDGGSDAHRRDATRRDVATGHAESGHGGEACTAVCGDAGCVDLLTDPTNCGWCGNNCNAAANISTAVCVAGTCSYVCAPWYEPASSCPDASDAAGCPVSLVSPANCGSCGRVCGVAAPYCTLTDGGAPTCVLNCGAGTDCSGSCVSLQSDSHNCGQCGHDCGSYACVGGQCGVCATDAGRCDGGGVQTCGTDGQWGPPVACDKGGGCCGGSCVDLQTSSANCGKCGTSCSSGMQCIGSECCAPANQPIGDCYCTSYGEISDSWFGDGDKNCTGSTLSCSKPTMNPIRFWISTTQAPGMQPLHRCKYTSSESGKPPRYFLSEPNCNVLSGITVTGTRSRDNRVSLS